MPLEYQVEALAAVEKRNAAAVEGRAAPEGEDSSIAAHEQWPRLGAA